MRSHNLRRVFDFKRILAFLGIVVVLSFGLSRAQAPTESARGIAQLERGELVAHTVGAR